MTKKTTNGTGDHVKQAEERLNRARGELAENTRETSDRLTEVDGLRQRIGQNPDERQAQAWAASVVIGESRLAYLSKRRPALEAAVREAEAALTEARASKAQAEIDAQNATLDRLNNEIIEGVARVLDCIEEHERIIAARTELAHAHGLTTPGRMRFLFPRNILLRRECELLRDRLKLAHVDGIRETGETPFVHLPIAAIS
jgi:multidrug efflux pump subunit AcrA (membrane-fusion protein)